MKRLMEKKANAKNVEQKKEEFKNAIQKLMCKKLKDLEMKLQKSENEKNELEKENGQLKLDLDNSKIIIGKKIKP